MMARAGFEINSSELIKVVAPNTLNYRVSKWDFVLTIDPLVTSLVILPPATDENKGVHYYVKNSTASIHPIMVTSENSQIDGDDTFMIDRPFQSLHVISNGGQWLTLN